MAYNYEKFDARDYDLVSFRGPKPGSKAPDFTLTTSDGARENLLDFDAPFLVLEMGSLTCPLFQGRRPSMGAIQDTHRDVAQAVLYVREAHPGDKISAHGTQAEKHACAVRLREEEGEARRILVDDLEGTAHSAYGGYPNSVFIINRNGCVVYASDWNNPRATAQALAQLKAGRPATSRAYFKPVPPSVSLRVLRQGGKGAMADFLRGLPRLVWNNLVLRNLRLVRGLPVEVSPETEC